MEPPPPPPLYPPHLQFIGGRPCHKAAVPQVHTGITCTKSVAMVAAVVHLLGTCAQVRSYMFIVFFRLMDLCSTGTHKKICSSPKLSLNNHASSVLLKPKPQPPVVSLYCSRWKSGETAWDPCACTGVRCAVTWRVGWIPSADLSWQCPDGAYLWYHVSAPLCVCWRSAGARELGPKT